MLFECRLSLSLLDERFYDYSILSINYHNHLLPFFLIWISSLCLWHGAHGCQMQWMSLQYLHIYTTKGTLEGTIYNKTTWNPRWHLAMWFSLWSKCRFSETSMLECSSLEEIFEGYGVCPCKQFSRVLKDANHTRHMWIILICSVTKIRNTAVDALSRKNFEMFVSNVLFFARRSLSSFERWSNWSKLWGNLLYFRVSHHFLATLHDFICMTFFVLLYFYQKLTKKSSVSSNFNSSNRLWNFAKCIYLNITALRAVYQSFKLQVTGMQISYYFNVSVIFANLLLNFYVCHKL